MKHRLPTYLAVSLAATTCQLQAQERPSKQAVAAEITESIVKNTGTDPNYIYVIFEDVAPSDWAGAGKLYGQETPEEG